MYKKIDGKFYQEVKLENLTKEQLIEMLKELREEKQVSIQPIQVPNCYPEPWKGLIITCDGLDHDRLWNQRSIL